MTTIIILVASKANLGLCVGLSSLPVGGLSEGRIAVFCDICSKIESHVLESLLKIDICIVNGRISHRSVVLLDR